MPDSPEATLVGVCNAVFNGPRKPPRARYALGIVAPGAPLQFVARGLIRHVHLLTPDLDRAHHFESVEAAREWIETTPDEHAVVKGPDGRPKGLPSALDLLRGRDLFVFRVKVEAEQPVAAWHIADRPATAGAAAEGKGGNVA